jgi:hypothetical protein
VELPTFSPEMVKCLPFATRSAKVPLSVGLKERPGDEPQYNRVRKLDGCLLQSSCLKPRKQTMASDGIFLAKGLVPTHDLMRTDLMRISRCWAWGPLRPRCSIRTPPNLVKGSVGRWRACYSRRGRIDGGVPKILRLRSSAVRTGEWL